MANHMRADTQAVLDRYGIRETWQPVLLRLRQYVRLYLEACGAKATMEARGMGPKRASKECAIYRTLLTPGYIPDLMRILGWGEVEMDRWMVKQGYKPTQTSA